MIGKIEATLALRIQSSHIRPVLADTTPLRRRIALLPDIESLAPPCPLDLDRVQHAALQLLRLC